jgi:hypothetical protein
MHMAFAHRVMTDGLLPSHARSLIAAQWSAFLLGSIAPDARVSSGIRRADTHFFEYEPVIAVPPITAMLTQYPTLARPDIRDDAHAAFIAGYGAHLAMDEIWCTALLFPKFMMLWNGSFSSFQMLHMLLGYLDARDLATLPASTDHPALASATPQSWLPFVPDTALIDWRDLIAAQIAPDGKNRTVEILSQRIKMSPDEMAAFIASAEKMDTHLWQNVPHALIAEVEAAMYERARGVLIDYLTL